MARKTSLDGWVHQQLTGEQTRSKPPRSKPPGPILLTFVTAAVAVWVCVKRNWWPSPFGAHTWADPLLAHLLVLVGLAVTGLVWAIRTLYVLGRDRRWSWWILPAPVLVLAAFAFVVWGPSTTFLDKRSEFEAIAVDIRNNPGTSRDEFEIGPFDIKRARGGGPSGEVYFVDNSTVFFSFTSGWVYSPEHEPAGLGNVDFSSTHLDGPWYRYESVYRD
ncbi:DUF1109 domain-containing protein [Rhodococcus sp. 14-2483-1-2]|uniref:DUF1109 domain-containing protein n=1 Tax=Rhodococcus sp. 14-2483-1-2 TaxID=2023147 RepID=UPI000B9C2650|nr:DUF1109 domain-containing protein [Rhodococcus sp. 14-2483-1-2]OZF26006.1 DUF1109 domain-containing protein [Rhodococcus sp. 14-2483-1-2]